MADHGSLRPPGSSSPAQFGMHRASSPGAIGSYSSSSSNSQVPGARASMSSAGGGGGSGGGPTSRYSLGSSKLSSSSSQGNHDNNNNNNANSTAAAMARLSQQQQQAVVAAAHAAAAAEQQARSPHMGGNLQMPTPNSAIGRGVRPSSEMLNMNNYQNTPESDAMDKWFEDLQHYEATLEDMAAASLDQNFKEELSAIEQWFRVLSEAERTAALYSLLQEATQVQIRFFITVLQQMARSDPMSALLSPAHANNALLDHMDQKFAALGLKSPTAMKSSNTTPNIAYRQSIDTAGYLSPNTAANIYSPSGADASASLAAQRAKLKANRISAPGTLPGERYGGSSLDNVVERDGSRSPQPHLYEHSQSGANRPKSTGGLSNIGDAQARSPRIGGGSLGPLDEQLSPLGAQGATWASLMNTPLAGFDDKSGGTSAADMRASFDAASAQLASINAEAGRNVLLDQDVNKYKRKSAQFGQGSGANGGGGGSGGPANANVQGVLSGMFDAGASPNLSAQWNQSHQDLLRQAMAAGSPNFNNGAGGFSLSSLAPASPNTLAGLQSPSGGMGNPLNMQMMNAMAAMGTLGSVNVNAAQFLAMQQQILQNQQSLAAMAEQQAQYANVGRMGGGVGGGNQGAGGARLVTPNTAQFSGSLGGRRSPRPGGTSSTGRGGAGAVGPAGAAAAAVAAAAAAGGEEEVVDISVLEDVPAWLRHLRLHKYTPNFEHSHWRDMVVMDERALEEKGVAALGARRKMLKTFEAVRAKYGITMPGEAEAGSGVGSGSGAAAGAADGGAEQNQEGGN